MMPLASAAANRSRDPLERPYSFVSAFRLAGLAGWGRPRARPLPHHALRRDPYAQVDPSVRGGASHEKTKTSLKAGLLAVGGHAAATCT